MSPREQDCVSTVPYTEAAVYTKPVLRSSGSVGELDDELAVVYDTAEEFVGPAKEAFGHAKVGGLIIIMMVSHVLPLFCRTPPAATSAWPPTTWPASRRRSSA